MTHNESAQELNTISINELSEEETQRIIEEFEAQDMKKRRIIKIVTYPFMIIAKLFCLLSFIILAFIEFVFSIVANLISFAGMFIAIVIVILTIIVLATTGFTWGTLIISGVTLLACFIAFVGGPLILAGIAFLKDMSLNAVRTNFYS